MRCRLRHERSRRALTERKFEANQRDAGTSTEGWREPTHESRGKPRLLIASTDRKGLHTSRGRLAGDDLASNDHRRYPSRVADVCKRVRIQ